MHDPNLPPGENAAMPVILFLWLLWLFPSVEEPCHATIWGQQDALPKSGRNRNKNQKEQKAAQILIGFITGKPKPAVFAVLLFVRKRFECVKDSQTKRWCSWNSC